MRQIRTKSKFKCDFCERATTRAAMEIHEKICFNNPDRYCGYCQNRGYVMEPFDVPECAVKVPCLYCSRKIEDLLCSTTAKSDAVLARRSFR